MRGLISAVAVCEHLRPTRFLSSASSPGLLLRPTKTFWLVATAKQSLHVGIVRGRRFSFKLTISQTGANNLEQVQGQVLGASLAVSCRLLS